MAWTARLIRTEPHESFTDFIVEFTNGTTFAREQFRAGLGVDTEGMKRRIFERLSRYNSPAKATIPDGETDFSPPPPIPSPPPTPPTQEDIDFESWNRDFSQLEAVETLVSRGVLLSNNAKVAELRASVKSKWQPAFLIRLGVS